MKIAISGKGGVGKTTFAAIAAKLLAEKKKKVLAIDADPDANLARTLGFPNPSSITPLIQMKELIEERMYTQLNTFGSFFKLNPKVDDIPDKYFVEYKGIRLAIMGSVIRGGEGCMCPQNTFLKALLSHLLIEREEVVILDMEAGIEHLGRATAEAVDRLIIIVEPSHYSIETAFKIHKLAKDIGIKKISVIGNKIQDEEDKKFIFDNIKEIDILGFIPYSEKMREVDKKNISLFELCDEILEEGRRIIERLEDV
jgi:CO dehydrogenase maturation factor